MLEKVREGGMKKYSRLLGANLAKAKIGKMSKASSLLTLSLAHLFSVSVSLVRSFKSTLTHGAGQFLLYIVTDPETNPSPTPKRASSFLFYLGLTFNDHS